LLRETLRGEVGEALRLRKKLVPSKLDKPSPRREGEIYIHFAVEGA
jgi:hypothetical protein